MSANLTYGNRIWIICLYVCILFICMYIVYMYGYCYLLILEFHWCCVMRCWDELLCCKLWLYLKCGEWLLWSFVIWLWYKCVLWTIEKLLCVCYINDVVPVWRGACVAWPVWRGACVAWPVWRWPVWRLFIWPVWRWISYWWLSVWNRILIAIDLWNEKL